MTITMKREEFYFTEELIREVNKVKLYIERQRCWQIGLLDPDRFTQLTRETETATFNAEEIKKLWQLGFLQADLVLSGTLLNIEGLINLYTEGNSYYYADERTMKEKKEGYTDSLPDLPDFPKGVTLLFHPYRSYALYHVNRTFRLSISPIQTVLSSKGFNKITSVHVEFFKGWTAKIETIQLFRYWNNISSLCAIAEPTAHRSIYHRVTWSYPENYETIISKLEELSTVICDLFRHIGEQRIEHYRREICGDAELLDSNRDLHLIIRLMNSEGRKELKGNIAGSVLFLSMAESLRRNLERAYGKEYPEEDECGSAEVFPEAKKQIYGSARVLDGDRSVANQFLRRFGLDYGIKLNIYVEGDTEDGALSAEFAENSSILVINLAGQFAERRGKGVGFRESLLNDIKAKTFSLILFDGDVSENLRAVQQAASADEICGMFFVFKPDFEFANFELHELAEIILMLASKKGMSQFSLPQIEGAVKDAHSSKELFQLLNKLSPDFSLLSKGKEWGEALLNYARKNPRSREFGDDNDRLINRVIAIAYRTMTSSYEFTRKKYKVNPDTGKLIQR